MSLLILLVSKNGEVVTRAEILSALWPNIVVGDEVISQLIYSLRNALTDDAKNPKYIETIPKKGYRFIAKVKLTATEHSTTEHSTTIDNKEITDSLQNNKHVSLKMKWLVSSCLLLIIVLISTWLLNPPLSHKNVSHLSIQNILPITKDIGVEGDFSFHENHNKMIYVSARVARVDLYLKTLGDNQSEQITNNEWVEYSTIWLDEQTISYIREKSGQYQIIRHELPSKVEVIYESDNAIFNLSLKTNEAAAISFIINIQKIYIYINYMKLNQ